MIQKDLGIVTAYAYAVSKGYTGTEEEYAKLMADYATVIPLANQSEENAEAWANGERSGAEVVPGDVTYHNNAKYFSE